MDRRKYTEDFMTALKDTYFSNSVNGPTDFLKGECRLLSFLNQSDNCEYQPGELSKNLGFTTARIASILRTLEKKGYINRRICPDDKRKVFVSITEPGSRYIEAKRENTCLFFDKAFEKLSDDECSSFIDILHKLTHS